MGEASWGGIKRLCTSQGWGQMPCTKTQPHRRQAEQLVRCGQFDGLVELATICALCNDSALDYNEVGPNSLL